MKTLFFPTRKGGVKYFKDPVKVDTAKNTANKRIALASSSKTKNKYLLKTMNIINRRINGTKKYHNPAFMYKLIE